MLFRSVSQSRYVARGFGERDEVWEALFDVYGAAEYRTLSSMLLCDTFKIDGKEWFFEGKELNPIDYYFVREMITGSNLSWQRYNDWAMKKWRTS